jgi:hypothetical protein
MAETTSFEAIQKLIAETERLYKIEKINNKQALSLIKSILADEKQFDLK